MLRVNVGISRKVSRDFNSTGFSVNLEGEITAPLDEPEVVIERIREYYDLAEEALRDQVDRHESVCAIASRDEENANACEVSPQRNESTLGSARQSSRVASPQPGRATQQNGSSSPPPATNKQVQFMLELAKRQGLTKPQLADRIATILRRDSPIDVYDLTKADAGVVLDTLTADGEQGSSRSRRSDTGVR